MRKGHYIIFVVLLFPLVCFAQELQPFSDRVSVDVTANEHIKGEIESYISRELRSLGDIIVTDDRPDWILNIVAVELLTKGGYQYGVVLSVVILKPFNNSVIINDVDEKNKQLISQFTSHLYLPPIHWLRTGPPEGLRRICNYIVAKFDTECLKIDRDLCSHFSQLLISIRGKQKNANKALHLNCTEQRSYASERVLRPGVGLV